MEQIDKVTIAKMDLCRERIEAEYGVEVSRAVARIMIIMMKAVCFESIQNDLDSVQLLGAVCKTIKTIDTLADTYAEQMRKTRNN